MASSLNPKAAEFVPGSYQSTDSNWGAMMEAEELGEVSKRHTLFCSASLRAPGPLVFLGLAGYLHLDA
jgi:hypothetical protein